MPEENNTEQDFEEKSTNQAQETSSDSVNGMEFSLFLILILLIMGNKTTFNSYFQLLNKQVNTFQDIINAFSKTANNLQGVLETPQQFQNLN